MEFLEPWLDRIAKPFHEAMQLYNKVYPSSVRAEHDDSVAAHIVHRHVVYGWEWNLAIPKDSMFWNAVV